jgi:hypothetical protein
MKTKEELEQKIECQKDTINQFEDIEIIKDYKQTKKHLKQLKQQLKDLPSLEVGKWYVSGSVPNWQMFVESVDCGGDVIYGYGIDYLGRWFSSVEGASNSANIETAERPATDKEVEEALIKEAKKRGFKEGVEYSSLYGSSDIGKVNNSGFIYKPSINCLCIKSGEQVDAIFRKGKWATIIEEPKTVNLNGEYTEVQLKDVLNSQFNKNK